MSLRSCFSISALMRFDSFTSSLRQQAIMDSSVMAAAAAAAAAAATGTGGAAAAAATRGGGGRRGGGRERRRMRKGRACSGGGGFALPAARPQRRRLRLLLLLRRPLSDGDPAPSRQPNFPARLTTRGQPNLPASTQRGRTAAAPNRKAGARARVGGCVTAFFPPHPHPASPFQPPHSD